MLWGIMAFESCSKPSVQECLEDKQIAESIERYIYETYIHGNAASKSQITGHAKDKEPLELRKLIDFDLSISLTKSVREFLHAKKLTVVVWSDDANPNHTVHQPQVGVSRKSPYNDYAGSGEFAIEIRCSAVAQIIKSVIADDSLESLRNGVKMLFYHEIGHLKLMQMGKSMDDIQYGETPAELYALSKVEKGSLDNGISAIAALVGITDYMTNGAFGIDNIINNSMMKHWEDLYWVQDFGYTKFRYLRDEFINGLIAQKAEEYGRLLHETLGPCKKPANRHAPPPLRHE